MANIASAKKRARQSEVRRMRNKMRRSAMRTQLKKAVLAIESGDHEKARAAYADAVRILDVSANRGIIHKNKAARHKSRLNAHILKMGA